LSNEEYVNLNITLATYNVDTKKIIPAVFSELDNKNIRIELDSSLSPKSFQDILDHLAVKVKINRWGDDSIPI